MPSYLNLQNFQKVSKENAKSLHHHESKALASEREDSRENWNTVDCRLVSSDCAGWLISSWDEGYGHRWGFWSAQECVRKCVRVRVSVGQALSDTREINPSFMYLQCQEAERCFRDMALRQAPRATHSPSANVSLYWRLSNLRNIKNKTFLSVPTYN